MILPNAIIIGAQKSGTSAMFNWLGQHPDIYAEPEMKDYNIFARTEAFNRELNWVLRSFNRWSNQKIILHGYVGYIDAGRECAQKIKQACDNCKIVAILRNPAERAYSGFWEAKKTGKEVRSKFEEAIFTDQDFQIVNENSEYIQRGLYTKNLSHYFEIFGEKSIFLISFKEVQENPSFVIKKLYDFLQVDSSFVPNFVRVNDSGLARSLTLQKILQKMRLPAYLKPYIPARYTSAIKRNLIRSVNVRKYNYPPMNKNTESCLALFYAKEIMALADKYGVRV